MEMEEKQSFIIFFLFSSWFNALFIFKKVIFYYQCETRHIFTAFRCLHCCTWLYKETKNRKNHLGNLNELIIISIPYWSCLALVIRSSQLVARSSKVSGLLGSLNRKSSFNWNFLTRKRTRIQICMTEPPKLMRSNYFMLSPREKRKHSR